MQYANYNFNYHFNYTDYRTIKCNKEKYVKCNNRMQGVCQTDQSVLSGLRLDQVLLPSSYQLSTFHEVGLSRSLTRISLSHAESQDLESCQQTKGSHQVTYATREFPFPSVLGYCWFFSGLGLNWSSVQNRPVNQKPKEVRKHTNSGSNGERYIHHCYGWPLWPTFFQNGTWQS